MRKVVVLWFTGIVAGACGGGGAGAPPGDAGPPPPSPDGAPIGTPIDAPPPADAPAPPAPHVGGWRMTGGDAAGTYRAAAITPPATAQARVFFEDPGRTLGVPVIDELGNLYLTSQADGPTTDVISLAPDGTLRWRTATAPGVTVSDLSLQPDGALAAVWSHGRTPTVTKLVALDAATGALRDGAVITDSELAGLRVGPDGRAFVSKVQFAQPSIPPAIEMHPTLDAPAAWTWPGEAFAMVIAPDASTLVAAARIADSPFVIVALDAATGAERWRFALPAGIDNVPAIAIGGDGATYVAAAPEFTIGDAVVTKLDRDGHVVWRHVEANQRASHLVIGAATVTANISGFAVSLAQADGQPVAASNALGAALAIDGADHLVLGEFGGLLTATLGQAQLGEWRGAARDAVIAPGGELFVAPSATGWRSTLFRIAPPAPLPPTTGTVTVHVFSPFDGTPFPSRVIFAGPHDEPIADVMTDAQGHASARMAAGYITVIRPSNTTGLDLTTVLGVKAGDTIEVGPRFADATSLGPLELQTPPIDTPFIEWFTPCSSVNFGSLSVLADPQCRTHVGVLARADTMPTPQFSYLTDQTLNGGTTLAMPAWRAMASTHIELTGFDPTQQIVFSGLGLFSDVGSTYEETDKDFIHGGGHGPSQNFWRPTIAGDLRYELQLRRTADHRLPAQSVWARLAAASDVTLAMTDLQARWLDPVFFSDGGPQAGFLWLQTGGDPGTVGWFSTQYASAGGFIRWDVVGPFANAGGPGLTAGSFVLPQLPDPALRFAPFSEPQFAQVRILGVNPEVGYDALRPSIGRLLAFEAAWGGGDFSLVDLDAAFAVPGVTRVQLTRSPPVVR